MIIQGIDFSNADVSVVNGDVFRSIVAKLSNGIRITFYQIGEKVHEFILHLDDNKVNLAGHESSYKVFMDLVAKNVSLK